MLANQTGIGIYKILIVIFVAGLIFILTLPQVFNLNRREKTEKCISNMQEIKDQIKKYMRDRNELFTGTTNDLIRTRYITVVEEECPEGPAGSKYSITVDRKTRIIRIYCPNEKKFDDHVLVLDSADYCVQNIIMINEAINQYIIDKKSLFGGNLAVLVQEGYINEDHVKCPTGGEYEVIVDQGAKSFDVYCPNRFRLRDHIYQLPQEN